MKRLLSCLVAFLVVLSAAVAALPVARTADSQQTVYSQQSEYSQQDGFGVSRVPKRSASAPAQDASNQASDASGAGAAVDDRFLKEVGDLEQNCFEAVNHQREAKGLHALEESDELLEVARDYSRRMAEEGFFSHIDPEGKSVRERVREAGLRWHVLGENLAFSRGYVSPVAATLVGWMDSPTHRKNILEPSYTEGAVGAWISSKGTVYFTQIFLKK
jgi:uncharacterized protein YkwD